MREINDIDPAPETEVEILRLGIEEIAQMAPGGHADPNNPCYGEKRRISDYAARIAGAALAAGAKERVDSARDRIIPDPGLTVREAQALRMALRHGVPTPLPQKLRDAREKLGRAEQATDV